MSEQPEGVDQQLSAGVEHPDGLAPGSDAAADADPAQDQERFRQAVQQEAEESRGGGT